ncbi:MAG TPA: hypothetical protein VGH12_03500, partial [Steroidobacteraceae bacterium]
MNTDVLPQLAAICIAALMVCSCNKAPPAAAAKAAADENSQQTAKHADEGVTLTPQQVEKIGLQTEVVKAIDHAEEVTGFGTIIPHETIAQAAAELATAEAVEKQSRSALVRTQRLSGTAGAMSADVEETSARQAAVDATALNLARRRLSAIFGQDAPWTHGSGALLQALASGSAKLVRATFPLGALPGADVPKTLRASRIGSAPTLGSWKVISVWPAPADASVPGRSFFGILHSGEVGEGERVIVWAPIGAAQAGVLIPAQAAVISDSKYWCYLEVKTGTFVRTELDTGRPVEGGYFVAKGIK